MITTTSAATADDDDDDDDVFEQMKMNCFRCLPPTNPKVSELAPCVRVLFSARPGGGFGFVWVFRLGKVDVFISHTSPHLLSHGGPHGVQNTRFTENRHITYGW